MIAIISCIAGCVVTPDSTAQQNVAADYIPLKIATIADAVPKYEQRTKAGNPKQYEIFGKQYQVLADSNGYQKKGVASWYGKKFHGRKTSNGEIFNMYAMTAAHKTLPIPSYVRVTHVKNKRSVIVRVNDRGPFHGNRVIDLSYAAAVKLGIKKTGTAVVNIVAIDVESPNKKQKKYTSNNAVKMYLQVAAFSSSHRAYRLQDKLIAKKISPLMVKVAKKSGGSIYRVQAGPFYSYKQMDAENQKLAGIGYKKTQLLVEKK